MNNKTRNIILGLGTAVAVGAVTYLISSDAAQDRLEALINRQKAKHFVKDTLKGNKKAMSVIDNLSDDEISNLLKTVDKVDDLQSKMGDYSDQIKDVTSDIKDMFVDKTKMLKDKITG